MLRFLTNLVPTGENSRRPRSKPAPATRSKSFRPQVEALEDRLVQSATNFSTVVWPTASYAENFSVNEKQQLMDQKADAHGDFGSWQSVPGTEHWRAWDVRAVRDRAGDVEVFVNGTDGHLWEITEKRGGGWTGWTDMKMSFREFDATADARGHVDVLGIDTKNDVLWQTTYNVHQDATGRPDGHWTNYWKPGGTFGFRDVAVGVDAKDGLNVFAVGLNDHHVWRFTEPKEVGGYSWKDMGGNFDHVIAEFDDGDRFGKGNVLWVTAWTGNATTTMMWNHQDGYGNWVGWDRTPPKWHLF